MNYQQVDETKYLYAITRRDLPLITASVQTSHAIFEAAHSFYDPQVEHPHFVICAVRDEIRLLAAAQKLDRLGIRYKIWREPDMLGNPITAIATEALAGDRRYLMRDFQLLKENTNE